MSACDIWTQALPLADAGFYNSDRPDTDTKENKCHYGRLFEGSTLCCLSYTALLSTKIRHTHAQIYLSPPTLCSFSPHSSCSFTAEKRYCALRLLPSLHSYCVHTVFLEMGDGGIHWDRSTDCWQIRNRASWCCTTGEWLGRVLSFLLIFQDLSWCFFFHFSSPQSLTGSVPVPKRKHCLHRWEKQSDELTLEDR